MTIYITKPIKDACAAYLNEAVDTDLAGTPILRRHTYPFDGNETKGLVDFAAGFAAGVGSVGGAQLEAKADIPEWTAKDVADLDKALGTSGVLGTPADKQEKNNG